MNISSTSWHYRFNKFVQGHAFSERALRGRFTTCSYIRTLIFSMISGATKAVVVAIISAWFATAIISGLVVPILIWFTSVQTAEPFNFMAALFWVCIACALAFLTVKFTVDRLKRINWSREKKHKEPSLFMQAIKDKHDKFCTQVKVKCE